MLFSSFFLGIFLRIFSLEIITFLFRGGIIPSVSACLQDFGPLKVEGFLRHPTWPLPHPWSTGYVPVTRITGGASLPTKVVFSLLSASWSLENKMGSHLNKADYIASNKLNLHSGTLCISVYITTDQKDQLLPGLLETIWLTAGKYHSKPFLPIKPPSVSLPVCACELQAPTIFDQPLTRFHISNSDNPQTLRIWSGPGIRTQDLSDENKHLASLSYTDNSRNKF